ncbi:MAG: flagella basal body P-ring formation protein FlgA [Rhodobiaceae bacterium]|nr:flagella basal body P-ring formation protein FlgA [Rhodobiaceae bacterium]
MKFSFSGINFIFGLTLLLIPSQGQGAPDNSKDEDILRDVVGVEVKEAVSDYLKTQQIKGIPMVRDDKFYFTCADDLETVATNETFKTIRVSCAYPVERNAYIRTRVEGSVVALNADNAANDNQATRIVLAHSVSAGELLSQENLKSVVIPHYNGFGGFFDLSHVVGRKTKTPLREGTVLLSRHLVPNWTIQAEQQVDIENTISGINVTTVGIAIENGHVGDIIKVKNLNSDTVIEGFVINRKKIKINAKVDFM